MRSKGILNDLELAEFFFENNVSKACIMLVSETIWNCREIDEHNVHLKHTF